MGYMRHHAIVITGWQAKNVEEAALEAERLGCICSRVVASEINGYLSFAIFPDGSKEGWSESDDGDARRNALIEWMRERSEAKGGSHYLDWVEVQYGDDNGVTRIVRHSDEE